MAGAVPEPEPLLDEGGAASGHPGQDSPPSPEDFSGFLSSSHTAGVPNEDVKECGACNERAHRETRKEVVEQSVGEGSAERTADRDGHGKTGALPESLSFDDIPIDDDELDAWEADEASPIPAGDCSIAESTQRLQERIGLHQPVDQDETWDDVEVDLPERTSVSDGWVEVADSPFRALLHASMLTGFVSRSDVLEVCLDENGDIDTDVERALDLVIAELGGRILDWSPLQTGHGSCLSDTDGDLLEEGLMFLEDLLANRANPFRHYMKELSRWKLLSADEELELAREMENAERDALESLARWPVGVDRVQEAGELVQTGIAEVGVYSSLQDISAQEEHLPVPDKDDAEQPDGQDEVPDQVAASFVAAILDLKTAKGDAGRVEVALQKARLTRKFLEDLADLAQSANEAQGLCQAMQRLTFARERMILCNLRLSLDVARKHLWSGLPLDDLVQEANIGLMKAVERYDWRKGFRFSTYATWWIRQQVGRAIANDGRVVRFPVHLQDAARQLLRGREEAEKRAGHAETDEETASRMGIPVSKVRLMQTLFEDTVSLEDPQLKRSVMEELEDHLTDERAAFLFENRELHEVVMRLVRGLDDRAREVIMFRFGLDGEDGRTLEETGEVFGLTRERIRQIEAKALKKLGVPAQRQVLMPFLRD